MTVQTVVLRLVWEGYSGWHYSPFYGHCILAGVDWVSTVICPRPKSVSPKV
jgi:hypothetical protein